MDDQPVMDDQAVIELMAGDRYGITETRQELIALVRKIKEQPIVIERNGRAVAAIISFENLRALAQQAEAYRHIQLAERAAKDATDYRTAGAMIAAMQERTAIRRARKAEQRVAA